MKSTVINPDNEFDLPMSLLFLTMIVVISVVSALYGMHSSSSSSTDVAEPFVSYTRCDRYPVQGIIKDIFASNGMSKDDESWDLYYPCTYTHVESELRKLRFNDKRIYAVDGCDLIASKNAIWRLLIDAYGRESAATLMPETYLAADPNELRAFLRGYSPGTLYICKKNVQRKKGLLLSQNLEELLRCHHRGYKVIQRYFKDVFLLGGRKLNLRVYVLVVCDVDGRRTAYIHRNGKCMYTNRPYIRDSTTFEEQITSVNLDSGVYADLPLDFVQLQRHLASTTAAAPVRFQTDVFDPMARKLRLVVSAVLPSLCSQSSIRQNVRFQLFGADVILTDSLEPFVLEFNKGPEMKPINDTDYALKRCVLEDVMRTAGVLPPESVMRPNGFQTLVELPPSL